MPRFVILEHDHPTLHWDFMLEAGEVLQTWRLSQPPSPGAIIEATALADHRMAYLDYEGPVSGGRGCVKRWDKGEFEDLPDSAGGVRRLVLHGSRISGTALLTRENGEIWQFFWS